MLASHSDVVVRAYFDELATAHKLAAAFEPLEASYAKGYIVLLLNGTDFRQLRGMERRYGLRLEIDKEQTLHYARRAVLFAEDLLPHVQGRTIPGFSCYRTVEETYAAAQTLVNTSPQLASWIDIGDSWEKTAGLGGYDLMVLRLSNSAVTGTKPKILISSGLHAREYTPAELAIRFAEHLIANYGIDADISWILDYHEIHFLLQANPDGRKHAETGLLWRKNTNQDYCGVASTNRGADLNRNFDFEWNCCNGSSGNQCSEVYRGPGAASEPETQTVQNYLRALFVDQRGPGLGDAAPLTSHGIFLDMHSSGGLVLWPWGLSFDVAPNGTQLRTLGRKLAFFNDYAPLQASGLYLTDGASDDFAYGDLGIAAYTLELGTAFFETCDEFEDNIVPDNFPALLYAAKVAGAPYQLPSGPDVVSPTLMPAPGLSDAVLLSAELDDTRYNNSDGGEPSQAIAAAEYYLDLPPWRAGASVMPMSAGDGAFDSAVETGEAVIDTGVLSAGRHIVFIRAMDSSNNWGPVSAVFLDVGASDTIFMDDFEAELGWVINPFSSDTAQSGYWQRGVPEQTNFNGVKQAGVVVSGDFALVTGAAAGSGTGANDVDDGVTSMLSPLIVLPDGQPLELQFWYYFAYHNASPSDYLRLSVLNGTSEIIVFEERADKNTDTDVIWRFFTASLDEYAGQSVYLLFEAADGLNSSIIEAGIDDFRIVLR